MDLCTIISRNGLYKQGYPDMLEIKGPVRLEGLVMPRIISYVSWYSIVCVSLCVYVYVRYVSVCLPLRLTSAQPAGSVAAVWVVWAAAPSRRTSALVCRSSVYKAGFPARTVPTQSLPTTWNKHRNHYMYLLFITFHCFITGVVYLCCVWVRTRTLKHNIPKNLFIIIAFKSRAFNFPI